MKLINLFIIFIASIISCTAQDTELERKAIIKCANVDSITTPFFIQGYTFEEFKKTIIKDFKDGELVNSFNMIPKDFGNYREKDSLSLKFWGDFGTSYFLINHVYQFCIPGYSPHIISNMKTHPTGCGRECFFCVIYQYEVDGVTKTGNIFEIIKRP